MTTAHIPPVLTAAELDELRRGASSLRILDVRTPSEFESRHIGGSYNVPIDLLSEHGREIAAVTEPIVLVCQSGQRARKAEAALQAAGLPSLHVLDGGIAAWESSGYPVVKGAPRLSLERQVRLVAGLIAGSGGVLALFVNPLFAVLPAVIGSGLAFSGITNTCGMAMVLAKLPYNRRASCDVAVMVGHLRAGTSPQGA